MGGYDKAENKVYVVLPSPTNYRTWTKVELPSCPQQRGSLQHILSRCSKALKDDQAFKANADTMNTVIRSSIVKQKNRMIIFKAGKKPERERKMYIKYPVISCRLVKESGSWFPIKIPSTENADNSEETISKSTKQLILLKLTIHRKENTGVANEMKRLKYQKLVEQWRMQG